MSNHQGTSRASLAAAALVAALAGCGETSVPGDRNPACELDGETERFPGYPYDLAAWNEQIAPLLAADCTASGCHADLAPPAGRLGGLTVFGAGTACDRVRTFEQVRAKIDLTAPERSRLRFALEGGALTDDLPHPLDYRSAEGGQAKLALLVDFIDAARVTCVADGGCAPDLREFFDREVFEDVVAPGLAAAGGGEGCAASAACHAGPDGQLGLVLPIAAPGADDIEAAYQAVTSRIDLEAEPTAALFFVRATVPHADGASTVIDEATAAAVLDWIDEAIRVRGGEGGCTDPALLDLGVFRDDILPILRGDVDLNGGSGIATGCTREPCHGQRRPGALVLRDDASVEDQLANFACFVSVTSPVSSQVLVCPRKDPRCSVGEHPGDRIFGDSADDQNYQRVMSFLFSAVTDSTPIDFAFFARRISPLFGNDDTVGDGNPQLSCDDARECHGVLAAHQVPPGGANLGILPNASDVAQLKVNFIEASAFLNFLTPDQSSLFLYPTNEIENQDNPAATGLPHPGGARFSVDSSFARDVLTFARGLRPDADGFQPSWLVAGEYPGADVRDDTPVDEEAATPQIFDESVGGALGGEWDALFSDGPDVDVGGFLGGEPGPGRLAHAVAYVFNTATSDRVVEVELTSINAALLRVGDDVADVAPGGTIQLRIVVPPTRASDAPAGSRIWVTLFEAPGDGGMRFRVRLLREGSDRPYDDRSELFLKLGPRGGV